MLTGWISENKKETLSVIFNKKVTQTQEPININRKDILCITIGITTDQKLTLKKYMQK